MISTRFSFCSPDRLGRGRAGRVRLEVGARRRVPAAAQRDAPLRLPRLGRPGAHHDHRHPR